ncbi:IspD/TarI family cytidylyltransferase [Microbacterium sp. ARD32]|uniref:IspD/TarI family cytidylyltransferase n=1 Tax=Microbacterium sp. ARD32 TaxID=2962577 RepID=UPI002880D71C|nr:IspD/TarI family cytidylyltransferase [Microbacterium sp. ARD32]MDT0156400.1 IspD/TarI family cytidylyltransferase [Microbacterium sp. ARD32]
MNIAVIFAGGVGSRMKLKSLPKQFLEVHGKPVIVHTLERFEEHPDIDGIVVAILPEYYEQLEKLVHRYDLTKVRIVNGGSTGQESRHFALRAVAEWYPADSVVLVHDGVRPHIDADLISANIAAVREHGSAITCTKVFETIVVSASGKVDDVIPRELLYTAQAPQSFILSEVLAAYDQAVADGENDSIDSCSLMRHYGHAVHMVEGPRSNIKITTADDFYISKSFFELAEARQLVEA